MSPETLEKVHHHIKIGNILGDSVHINIKNPLDNISEKKQIELKALSLFQKMDGFGHITDSHWFLGLQKLQLIRFIRELQDIWDYRAQIANSVQYLISPPYGRPFLGIHINNLHTKSERYIQKKVLHIMENFICKSQDPEYQKLGAMYVLGAFTLVNTHAAAALPWLFQSMQLH